MDTNTLTILLLNKKELNLKDRYYLRINGWENVFQPNGPKRQVGLKQKSTKRYGGHLILITEKFNKMKTQS